MTVGIVRDVTSALANERVNVTGMSTNLIRQHMADCTVDRGGWITTVIQCSDRAENS